MRLNELDPYQRNEYQKLMSENNDLVAEYSSKAAAMD